jgi:nicotinate-nucleotide adenylyltransferase
MSRLRLGLFGGSFDPIHRGHVAPVQEARRELGLTRVIYLPTAAPPHKPKREFAPALARYAMVELALLGEEGLYASSHELTLGRPAYTVETLEHFGRLHPEAELHLLIGGDSFVDLPHWYRWREIPERARLIVLERPGWRLAGPEVHEDLAGMLAGGRAVVMDRRPVDVSSTRLREALARGEEPPAGALSPLVLDYIRKYNLYR